MITPEERAAQLWALPQFRFRVMDVDFCHAIADAIRLAVAEATVPAPEVVYLYRGNDLVPSSLLT